MARPLGVKLKAFLLRWPEDPSVVADLGVPASNLSLVNSLKILKKVPNILVTERLLAKKSHKATKMP